MEALHWQFPGSYKRTKATSQRSGCIKLSIRTFVAAHGYRALSCHTHGGLELIDLLEFDSVVNFPSWENTAAFFLQFRIGIHTFFIRNVIENLIKEK